MVLRGITMVRGYFGGHRRGGRFSKGFGGGLLASSHMCGNGRCPPFFLFFCLSWFFVSVCVFFVMLEALFCHSVTPGTRFEPIGRFGSDIGRPVI